LRAQIALGIVKATPKARPPVGNGGGVKLPEKERPLSGETMQAMSRRRAEERKEQLREAWIDHWYREIDAAYHRYVSIKARNLDAIADLGGRG